MNRIQGSTIIPKDEKPLGNRDQKTFISPSLNQQSVRAIFINEKRKQAVVLTPDQTISSSSSSPLLPHPLASRVQ